MFGKKLSWFLLVIFIAAFWWAGGSNMLPMLENKATTLLPANSVTASVPERLYRIVALKSAVKEKLDKRQDYIKLQDIPLAMQQSIIAVEDNRFHRHHGFDIEGIIRAALVNLQTGAITEGGSTITQQLVKNLFLSQEKTYLRKFEEVILAINMEICYSKENILEMYLNTIYFGSQAYGIGEAARVYFAKKPSELSLAECAMLAGLPNAPSVYSPYVNFNAAKQRQAVVLNALVRYGYLSPQVAQETKQLPIKLAK